MKLGAVSYLNTKPLVYGLPATGDGIDLVFDLPSRLADRLATGELDVALIPSVEFFQNPAYTIVSDACIGCRGPVFSVKLFSRAPIPQIKTLALDEGSRTSAALIQILLKERHGISPQLLPLPISAPWEDAPADAMLVIGDRAMHPPGKCEFAEVWDLGDVWCRWSELPFVFAMWVARPGIGDTSELAARLSLARDRGVADLNKIATVEAPRYQLGHDQCLCYLRDNLHFTLGPREMAGLHLFYEHAVSLNLAPPGREWSQILRSRPLGLSQRGDHWPATTEIDRSEGDHRPCAGGAITFEAGTARPKTDRSTVINPVVVDKSI